MPGTAFALDPDGFAFANSWTLDEDEQSRLRGALTAAVNIALITISPILAGPLLVLGVGRKLSDRIASGLPETYGLCGGMAFAALDYYLSGLPTPRGSGPSDRPTRETPNGAVLRDYLLQRMMDSLTIGRAAAHTLAWMGALHLLPERWPFRGGASWLLARTKKDWLELRAHINADRPWPIGLVGTTSDPFENHQVLAYGYDDNDDGTSTIYVYDMNCPGDGQTIQADFRGDMLQANESCAGARGELRGFFCETYSAKQPPAIGQD